LQVLAAALLATLFIATPSQATIIQVDVVGIVTTSNPGAPAMQTVGVPFTAQIKLNTLSPDQGSGGTRIASFGQGGVPPAIISYKIDGFEFAGPGQDDQTVSFSRQTTRDLLSIDTLGNDASELSVEFGGILPLNFFGAGPYTLDQLLVLTLADFTSTFGPEIYDDSFALLAAGEVTSFSVSVVPEPSLLGLALGVLPGLAFGLRRTGGATCFSRRRRALRSRRSGTAESPAPRLSAARRVDVRRRRRAARRTPRSRPPRTRPRRTSAGCRR
jgi:hypothetical protein